MTDLSKQAVVPPHSSYPIRKPDLRREIIEEYEWERSRLGIEYGECFCGCHGKTSVAKRTCASDRKAKGIPLRYLPCHHHASPLRTFETVFLQHADKTPGWGPNGDCWRWTGTVASGYGTFKMAYVTRRAHRISWEIHNGHPLPKGKDALHTCDYALCVNPSHLYPGTNEDNSRDRVSRNRQSRGENQFSAKLTNEQVLEIRRRLANGEVAYALTKVYKVSHPTIMKIKKRIRWKHI